MKIGNSQVNWMSNGNDSLWAWVDAKIGRYWYVFIWKKWYAPYLYRSLDATPPIDAVNVESGERMFNDGRMIFGRYK